jgi:hypothetical protein
LSDLAAAFSSIGARQSTWVISLKMWHGRPARDPVSSFVAWMPIHFKSPVCDLVKPTATLRRLNREILTPEFHTRPLTVEKPNSSFARTRTNTEQHGLNEHRLTLSIIFQQAYNVMVNL